MGGGKWHHANRSTFSCSSFSECAPCPRSRSASRAQMTLPSRLPLLPSSSSYLYLTFSLYCVIETASSRHGHLSAVDLFLPPSCSLCINTFVRVSCRVDLTLDV
ncbi:hypothetical protein TRVL_01026 [Trypanosoma vivax]|nr:hypothetical protein TRVL_01026 [Trypanosoma vivax]